VKRASLLNPTVSKKEKKKKLQIAARVKINGLKAAAV
jgi:hypothetical protein